MNITGIILCAVVFSLSAVIIGLTLGKILMIRKRHRKFGKTRMGGVWFRE